MCDGHNGPCSNNIFSSAAMTTIPERSARNPCIPAGDAPYILQLGDIPIQMHVWGGHKVVDRRSIFPSNPKKICSVSFSIFMGSLQPPSKAFYTKNPSRLREHLSRNQPLAHQPSARRHLPALPCLSSSHRHEIRGGDLNSS